MYRATSVTTRKDGSKHRLAYYRCHGNIRAPTRCRNMVRLDGLDAWVDEQMRANGGFVLEVMTVPGRDHADEIAEVKKDMADAVQAEDFARLDGLRAELDRLRALPPEPSEVIEEVANYTVGDLWGWFTPEERRQYLLDSQARVVVNGRGDYEIEGDLCSVASWGLFPQPPVPVPEPVAA